MLNKAGLHKRPEHHHKLILLMTTGNEFSQQPAYLAVRTLNLFHCLHSWASFSRSGQSNIEMIIRISLGASTEFG